MSILEMVRAVFKDTTTVDPHRPTDQAVSNAVRQSRDASVARQERRTMTKSTERVELRRQRHAIEVALRREDETQ